jgi:pilus assembly protein Flp/PilA
MSKCVEFLKQLGRDEEGTALVEYTILLGLIAVAVIATAITVGAWVSGQWSTLCNALPNHGTC